MTPTDRTRFTPRLENLAAREVPAVQIFVTDHVLHVVGDGHANAITIRDDGHGTIAVTAGAEHFSAAGIHGVDIDTGRGTDTVSYRLTGPLATTETIHAHLGRGADKATFDFSAGVAATGHLRLDLWDGRGADRDAVKVGSIAKGGSAVVHVDGGKGADDIRFRSSGTVAGRLVASLLGQDGHDTEDVHLGATVAAGGHVNVTAR